MADTMRVRSKLKKNDDGSAPVAFWEKDEAHPGGEAFVAGDGEHEIGRTSQAMLAIKQDRLVEVKGESKPAPKKPGE